MSNHTSGKKQRNVLKAVAGYIDDGYCVIPVSPKSKAPHDKKWQELRIDKADIRKHFEPPDNIGIHTGEPSNGLVDVDLDSPETRALADEFLPKTALISGRKSSPRSHRWYYVEPIPDYKKYTDPKADDGKRSTLVEVRATGHQTLVPPSVHPEGEKIIWYKKGEPTEISGLELENAVARLASCALVARHWPGEGSRNDAALALAGTLLRSGWSTEDSKHFIMHAARIAGDEEWRQRGDAAGSTEKRLSNNGQATGVPTLAELIGTEVVAKLTAWLELQSQSDEPMQSANQVSLILNLTKDVVLFHTPDMEMFAILQVNGHNENYNLKSSEFEDWTRKSIYEQTGRSIKDQVWKEAVSILRFRARYSGPEHDVHLRLASEADKTYIDLGTKDWSAVELDGKGWKVVTSVPVKFYRPRSMYPLSVPEPGGNIDQLRKLLNIGSKENWVMIASWVIAALRARGPYPILTLYGEQGSGKSTAARMLRALVDNGKPLLRHLPGGSRDLMIAAKNSWCLAFDNVSYIDPQLSDALCQLSTGGGFATRELWTNDSEKIFEATRPVLLNGIDGLIVRGDLLDRAIVIYLPCLDEGKRRPEDEMWNEFWKQLPQITGAVLDIVSSAQKRLPKVANIPYPRMADFAKYGTAAESDLGCSEGEFLEIYARNRQSANDAVLDSSSIVPALKKWLGSLEDGSWNGSATRLHERLTTQAKSLDEGVVQGKGWPKTAGKLTEQLRRLAPNLRLSGIKVEFGQTSGDQSRKYIEITKKS